MVDNILNIATLGIKPIYDKHQKFYQIIADFRNKLPRPQNTARIFTDKELATHPVLSELKDFTVFDLSTHVTSISETDLDEFYNQLNNFDLRLMLFQDYYKGIIRNLNRFNPQAENRNFDLVMVQLILKEDPFHPLKPLDVLIFNLKWNVKWSSFIYVRLLKMMKRYDT